MSDKIGRVNTCDSCHVNNITRICLDCNPPIKEFCENCFIKNHSGMSTKNHTTTDPVYRAVILNKNSFSALHDLDLISLRPILSHQNSQDDKFSTDEEKVEKVTTDSVDSVSISKNEDEYLSNIDKYLECDNGSIILPQESLINEEHCILFESSNITQFKSIENLGAVLKIKDSFVDLKLPIITFISKPINKGNSANYLLLENNKIKFPVENDRTENPLCYMVYDTEHNCLILDARYMYKTNNKYFDYQTKLMNLILALSDIIVYSENSTKSDFIRMHDMMETFRKRFYQLLYKVHKANPKCLAPGLIYLTFSNTDFKDNLEMCIENTVDRKELFASYSEILDFQKKNFWNGLENMILNLSIHRTRHSLGEILLCINNCTESLNFSQDNILSNDIPSSWFICTMLCELCNVQCTKPYDHSSCHDNQVSCIQTTNNEVYFCKKCMKKNLDRPNLPLQLKPISKEESFFKNVLLCPFRRGVVECEEHKIIHDDNWIYNSYEDGVQIQYFHKWPGNHLLYENAYPVGRMIMDKWKTISEPATKIASQSVECLTDLIIPEDWQSTRVTFCGCCNSEFTNKMWKHHCRSCKKVICTACSIVNKNSLNCKKCINNNMICNSTEEPTGIAFLNIFRDTINYSSNFLRRNITAISRPQYWENDDDVIRCFICQSEFHCENNPIHHCRSCGKCVCDPCSPELRTVEWRCLYEPSRICNKCIQNQSWRKTV